MVIWRWIGQWFWLSIFGSFDWNAILWWFPFHANTRQSVREIKLVSFICVHLLALMQFKSLYSIDFYIEISFRYWSVSSRGRLQRIGDPHGSCKPYLMRISQLEERLIRNGKYEVATTYDRSKLPHLVTWFQSDQAMVMYLSNHTVQVISLNLIHNFILTQSIKKLNLKSTASLWYQNFQMNFSKTHQKLIICPHNETITFVSNKICRKNFKTVKFDTLAASGFSMKDFKMFEYVTTSIKHLITMLINEWWWAHGRWMQSNLKSKYTFLHSVCFFYVLFWHFVYWYININWINWRMEMNKLPLFCIPFIGTLTFVSLLCVQVIFFYLMWSISDFWS